MAASQQPGGGGGSRVPVRLGNFSVLDKEFGSIRERFDGEMKKMEDEMNNFRSELLSKESSFFNRSSTSSTSASVSDGSFMSSGGGALGGGGGGALGLGSHSDWLHGLDSPLIKQKPESPQGEKQLKLRFDVSQYAPEEIMVKTVDNKLLVHAKHEEKGEGKSVYREYNREFLLPAGTDPESIQSSLSKDGILTVEAPLPQAIAKQ